MHYTFNRNITYQSIMDGQYSNIRYITMNRFDTSNVTFVLPPMDKHPVNQWQAVRPEIANISLGWSLDKFSAPCWYFAQSLVDLYGLKDVNLGLIDTAVGGTKIEQWIQNKTGTSSLKKVTCFKMLENV